jgi:hypothetical protein
MIPYPRWVQSVMETRKPQLNEKFDWRSTQFICLPFKKRSYRSSHEVDTFNIDCILPFTRNFWTDFHEILIGVLYYKLPGEIDFELYRTNVASTLHEADIDLNIFSQNLKISTWHKIWSN